MVEVWERAGGYRVHFTSPRDSTTGPQVLFDVANDVHLRRAAEELRTVAELFASFASFQVAHAADAHAADALPNGTVRR